MKHEIWTSSSLVAVARAFCIASALLMPLTQAHAADGADLKNRSIGYVTSDLHWALYQTANGKTECPDGMNDEGPREIFKQMFPKGGSVVGTQLAREAINWFPQGADVKVPYLEAKGKIAPGLNLDGKVGANDFTSPDGEKGIDNQLYRVLGCSRFYRGPDGTYYIFGSKYLQSFPFNRSLIEITNVDNLVNDSAVDVTIYRGLDKLLTDASGEKIVPGGSERIDTRFGKRLIQHLHGKIENGVLTTEPADIYWIWSCFGGVPGGEYIRGMRFKLTLTSESAQGFIGGYTDVDNFYTHLIGCQSTHHLSYGQLSAPGFYQALRRNADGVPDKDGHMTAISSAIAISMEQVFVIHDEHQVATSEPNQHHPDASASQH